VSAGGWGAREIIDALGLEPLPVEGGYFRRTYESDLWTGGADAPEGGKARRRLATAIYYLVTGDEFSAMHRLASDEIFHFYLGDPVEMLRLYPDGSGDVTIIGPDLARGMQPQVVVPRGVWQGARLVPGGRFALLGTTVSPGFEYDDYEHGDREALASQYPAFRAVIEALTRPGSPR